MSKLYFRYGAMNSGKSTILMQVAHNYEENGKRVIVIKPAIDTKGNEFLSARIGIKRKVDILADKDDNLMAYFNNWKDNVSCILVDEVQFLTSTQIEDLWRATKILNIPVICYGIKTDFQSHLFEGSKRLFELADEIEEIATICKCGKKARFNSRYINGKFTLDGDEILIDGADTEVKYVPLCGECYLKEYDKYRKSVSES